MKNTTKIAVNAQRLPVRAARVADSAWNGAPAAGFVAVHAAATTSVKTRAAVPALPVTPTSYERGTTPVLIHDPNPPV